MLLYRTGMASLFIISSVIQLSITSSLRSRNKPRQDNQNNNNNNNYTRIVVANTESAADDDCQSLYYDTNILSDGRGIPNTGTLDAGQISALRSVRDEYKKLPFELYKTIVECMPIVCVDVVCQRKLDGKLLLFYRRDKPASHIWWWPGSAI